MNPTGALLAVLGVFVLGRLFFKDSNGETLAGRLAGGQPSNQQLGAGSTSSSTAQYAPAGKATTGAARVIASRATGLAAQTHSPAYARDVLRSLGDPRTAANVSSLTAWINREGNDPSIDLYNPLDTTQPEPGSHGTNSVHVQTYKSWGSGVTATAKTIANGLYPAIAAAFKSGQGLTAATNPEQSHELLTWSGGGYAGF